MAVYKGFPKEWPPIKVNPFKDFDIAYRNVRDSFSAVNDLRKILTTVFENLGPIDVKKDFGAKGDGVTDDAIAIQAAFDALPLTGGVVIFPPGSYMVGTTPVMTSPSAWEIWGYGAEIKTTGAISALKIASGVQHYRKAIRGLHINHRNNNDATFGIELIGTSCVSLYDVSVRANTSNAAYAAFHVANTTASDPDTGSFWNSFHNCRCREEDSADPNNIPIGILIEGSSNATSVLGGALSNTTTGIRIRNQGGEALVPNAVLINGVSFEAYTTGIHVSGLAASNISGLRCVNNRFENGTTVFSFTVITQQPATGPFLAGNYLISNAGTYLNNPENLHINIFDFSVTPDTGQVAQLRSHDGLKVIVNSGSSAHAMMAQAGANGFGFQLLDNTGGEAGTWAQASGGGSEFNKITKTTFLNGRTWQVGTGTPEGVETATIGSLFTRTDGGANTTLYVKESGTGNTGWVAK